MSNLTQDSNLFINFELDLWIRLMNENELMKVGTIIYNGGQLNLDRAFTGWLPVYAHTMDDLMFTLISMQSGASRLVD